EEYGASQDCKAAIHLAAAQADIAGGSAAKGPEGPAGFEIESGGLAGRLGNIHDAVGNERRSFELIEVVGLILPGYFEMTYIVAIDLRERRIAMAGVSARV